jgi:hypothetical protein
MEAKERMVRVGEVMIGACIFVPPLLRNLRTERRHPNIVRTYCNKVKKKICNSAFAALETEVGTICDSCTFDRKINLGYNFRTRDGHFSST